MAKVNLNKDETYNYDRNLVAAAILKWRGFDRRSSLTVRDFIEFAAFIGHPTTGDAGKVVPTHKPEVRHLIDLINGPNGYAILKMLEIRNNDNDASNL